MTFSKIKMFFLNKKNYYLIKKYNKAGNKISYGSKVDDKTVFEGKNEIYNADVSRSLIGFCTSIGGGSRFVNCKIGKFCSISANCKVVDSIHPTNFVSTYAGFFDSINHRWPFASHNFDEFLKTPNGFSVEIGNDVWIGTDVLIKGGVTIGDGAIVGMGSIVTKNVEPYSIVAGNPARLIRYRFSDEEIEKLKATKWWDWSESTIESKKEDFYDIKNFNNEK